MFSSFVTETLGFSPTHIDPDVYYKKNYHSDGTAYYEYLLVYIDDVLAISLDPNVGGSDLALANHNVCSKHTVASKKIVVSLMILLKL
jgi:hypothetical protein